MPKTKLLLVDDKPANLTALDAVLGGNEYELIFANSGAEAIEALARQPVALVLLDIQMPGMDGFETARRMKQLPGCAELPIIFITAVYNEDPFVRRGYEAGAIDYFGKPFDPEILKLKVRLYASFQQKSLLLAEREARVTESEELLHASRKLAGVLESLPVGVIIADAAGRICQTNAEATRIWGPATVDEADDYGEYLDWWDSDGRLIKARDGALSRALNGHSTQNEVLPVHRFDGSVKSVLVSASPLYAAQSHVVGAVIVLRDVTEQKQIHQEMMDGLQKLVSAGFDLEHGGAIP